MGDFETWILVGTALAGLAAVVQHLYDRFAPKGLYLRSARLASELPTRIGSELKVAVEGLETHWEAFTPVALEGAMYGAMKRLATEQIATAEAEATSALRSAQMSGTRQIGIEKAQMKELKGLMVEGIGGPVFKALEAWNPEWADKLRELDPDLLLQFIESPWFQRNIMPRIQPLLSKFLGGKGEGVSDVNPFLGGLGP